MNKSPILLIIYGENMELLGYDFPSITETVKEQYYDVIYATLRAGVVGRESKQNMLLIGEQTVNAFKYLEDEKYNTFFATIHAFQSANPNCIGFIEKSEKVANTLLEIGFEDIEGKSTKNDEIIGIIIFSEEEIGSIRAKKELGLDDSLKLLSACFTTIFVLCEIHKVPLELELIVFLYYFTEDTLKELYKQGE